jgi:purine nucleoside permease
VGRLCSRQGQAENQQGEGDLADVQLHGKTYEGRDVRRDPQAVQVQADGAEKFWVHQTEDNAVFQVVTDEGGVDFSSFDP